MLRKLLRPRGNRQVIEALHGRIVAAARRPALFLPPYEVPDTLDGRFDLLVLFSVLLLRRLERLPDPGPEIAQEFVNTTFDHLDTDLREMGVGDLAVPKRIKKLAEAFGGRNAAYREALGRAKPSFTAAIARNIYGSDEADGRAVALAAYCDNAIRELEGAGLADILAGLAFPDPELNHAR
jgi:cytochrome b pre-mRNA-processing protein 3